MAREFVNFQVIKERVSLQNILDHYSIDWLRPSGDELIGRCPIHQGKGTRSFHLNLTKNLFNCFSCGAKGSSVIDFVAAKEQCSVRQAALKLQAWFCITDDAGKAGRQPPKTTRQVQKPALINPPLPFKLRIDPGHAYGYRRVVFGGCLKAGVKPDSEERRHQ